MDIPASIAEEINKKIASGMYRSPEDVLKRALNVLSDYDAAEVEIRENIRIGRQQLDRGEGISGEKVFSELRERNKAFRLKMDK